METLKFYAIEGLDGVGKSTLLEELSKLGHRTFKTPSDDFNCLRKKIHNLKKSSLFFYFSSLCYLIEKEANGINNFFVDRYIFSTISNYAFYNKIPLNEVDELFKIFTRFVSLPKITFFLVLDYKERLKRIKKRNNNRSQFDDLSLEYNNYILELIKNYSLSKKIILDASKSKKDIVKEVIFYVKESNG